MSERTQNAAERIALTAEGQGIVLHRHTENGSRCEVSADGVTWRAQEGSAPEAAYPPPLPGDAPWYEPLAEPEMTVVPERAATGWRAFFCARRRSGRHPERLGCIGTARSADLRSWEMEPPIYAPNSFARLHSPHLFAEAGRTVLFYSTPEEGGHRAVRFALGQGSEGPFERTEPDVLAADVRCAVQTVMLRERRLAFFLRPSHEAPMRMELSRPGSLDFHPDGRPFVRFYEGLLKLLGRALFQTEATLASGEPLVRVLPRMGGEFRYAARIRSRGATGAGLLFRTSMTGHENMTLWLEFDSGAVTLRRGVNGRIEARARRKLDPAREHQVAIWVEGRFADVYVDEEWVLSGRSEGRQSGGFGVAVRGGEARFEGITAQQIGTERTNSE